MDALWAAFKAFDVQENDGHITAEEIAQVLYEASDEMFSRARCEQIAKEVVEQFDSSWEKVAYIGGEMEKG